MSTSGVHSVIPLVSNNRNVPIDTFSFTWDIRNFNSCRRNIGQDLLSPILSVPVNDTLRWILFLKLETLDKKYKDYTLFLTLISYDTNAVRVQLKLSILNSKCERANLLCPNTRIVVNGGKWSDYYYIGPDLVFFHTNRFWSNNYLRIFCGISVVQVDYVDIKVPDCSLSDDFGHLFEDKQFSDVILSVAGYEFKVHKAILSVRSPVFAAMFKHDMKERNTGIVKIDDVSQDVMEEVLRFVYTGKVLNIDKMADDLLTAADKYQLDRLKAMCEKSLRKNLSIENVSEVLILADFHNADQLKLQTIEFINTHGIDVIETEGFKTMMDTNPGLIAEEFVASLMDRKLKI